MTAFRGMRADNEITLLSDGKIVYFISRDFREDTPEIEINEWGIKLFEQPEINNVSHMIIDFKGTSFLSAAAIIKLMHLDKKLKAIHGQLRLCGLKAELHEVFKLLRLNTLIRIHATFEEALQSLPT